MEAQRWHIADLSEGNVIRKTLCGQALNGSPQGPAERTADNVCIDCADNYFILYGTGEPTPYDGIVKAIADGMVVHDR